MNAIERYEYWSNQFQELLNDIRPECLDESVDWDNMALRFMQFEEDQVAEAAQRVSTFQKEHAPEQVKTQLITISIDKNLSENDAIETQYLVFDAIAKAEYKFLADAECKFEYFTEKGFNPHIHIMTRKIKTDGQVAQQIRRKFNKVESVYRVHVSTLTFKEHSDYLHGVKTESKEEYVRKDEVFREIHNINNIFKF